MTNESGPRARMAEPCPRTWAGLVKQVVRWHTKAFGDPRDFQIELKNKLAEEVREYEENRCIQEFSDVVLVAINLAAAEGSGDLIPFWVDTSLHSHTPDIRARQTPQLTWLHIEAERRHRTWRTQDVLDACFRKLQINRLRTWEYRDGTYHHVEAE